MRVLNPLPPNFTVLQCAPKTDTWCSDCMHIQWVSRHAASVSHSRVPISQHCKLLLVSLYMGFWSVFADAFAADARELMVAH